MKKLSTFAAAFLHLLSFMESHFERKNFVGPLLSARIEAALAYVCTMYVQLLQLCVSEPVAKLSQCTWFSGEYVLNIKNINLFQVNK